MNANEKVQKQKKVSRLELYDDIVNLVWFLFKIDTLTIYVLAFEAIRYIEITNLRRRKSCVFDSISLGLPLVSR